LKPDVNPSPTEVGSGSTASARLLSDYSKQRVHTDALTL